MTTRSSAISKFLAATLTTALALGALSSCAHAGGEQSPSGPPASRLTPQWHSPVTANTPTARHENAFVAIGQKLYLAAGSGNRGGGPELGDLLVLEQGGAKER